MYGENTKFFKRFEVCVYSNNKDKWIGHYSKDRSGQDSGCEFVTTTHYVCLIPCIVIQFDTKRYSKHQKGCWHNKKRN